MRLLTAALTIAVGAGVALATPLTLEFCVSDNPDGSFQYQFVLTLDNNDGSWQPGHSFNWILFADGSQTPANLPDFIGDLPAPPPFNEEGFSSSSGGHNGPTLLDFGTNFDFRGWVPAAIGETLRWSGRSQIRLGAGDLLWSNINGSGVQANLVGQTYSDLCGDAYCPADYNGNGGVDGGDVEAFFVDWQDGLPAADVDRNGGTDGGDVETFFIAWQNGGC